MKSKIFSTRCMALVALGFFMLSGGCEKEEETVFLKGTGQVTDIDGNVYPTVIIGHPFLDMGTQEWMAEDLRVIHYRDGSPIVYAANADEWHHIEEGAGVYTFYDFDYDQYGQYYGPLYNGYTVTHPAGLCPAGWRMPTIDEWETLTVYLGTRNKAGGRMKSLRTAPGDGHPRWDSPNTGATNESGFSALPAGLMGTHGHPASVGQLSFWWTTTKDAPTVQVAYGAHFDQSVIGYGRFHPLHGFSVRCIKD